MSRKQTILFIFILLFIVPLETIAQSLPKNADYITDIQHFTKEDGLSSTLINSYAKDARGILWIGTKDGLNRFDGKKFKAYFTEDGLVDNTIKQLFSNGEIIWCIHNDEVAGSYKDVSLFHSTKEKAVSWEAYIGSKAPFQKQDIETIYLAQDNLFLQLKASSGGQTYHYDNKEFKLLHFLNKNEIVEHVSPNKDYWVRLENEKQISLRKISNTGENLLYITDTTMTMTPYVQFNFIGQTIQGETIFGTLTDIVRESQYFRIQQDGTVDISKSPLIPLGEFNFIPGYAKDSYLAKLDAFWFGGRKSSGLLCNLKGEIIYELHLDKKLSGAFFVDNQIIWSPTTDGLYQIEIKKNLFKPFLTGKEDGGFRGIVKIDNDLYCSSGSGVYQVPVSLNSSNRIFKAGLSALKDSKNNLWVRSLNYFVKYNPTTKETTKYKIGHEEVWSLFEDKNGWIWHSHLGLNALDPTTKEIHSVQYNEFEALQKSTVYHFYQKKDGNIWLCTTSGLYEMNLDKGIIARYWSGGKGAYYLPADDFRHFYFNEKNQTYWLAASGKGLVQWTPKTQETKLLPLHHTGSNIIHAVYPDKFGFLWLSTENGILQFNKATHEVRAYLPKDGISSHEFNRISHFQDEDGTIYFGSINGITAFHPKDFVNQNKIQEKVKTIVVELNQHLNKTAKLENLTRDFYQQRRIVLNPGDRFFNLKLTLNNYKYINKAIYYYKIKETNEDWIKATSNEISISGLPSGQQTLMIKALLSNGQFTQDILEIPILVRIPFYLTWWFFGALFLLISGSTVAIIKWRTHRLLQQKIALEKEVEHRTAQIQADKKIIEEDKKIIEEDKKIIEEQAKELRKLDKTKSRFFANVSHELRTPITLIQGPIQSVLKTNDLSDRNLKLLTRAEQSTQSLLKLVTEILDLTKLESHKMHIEETSVVFYNLVRRIISNFQSISDAKAIRLIFNYEPSEALKIEIDIDKFEKIFTNLLTNALKFTPKNGRISVYIKDLGKSLQLEVQDNGRGIPEEDIPHIFNRFYQSSINTKAEGGMGIGLSLAMEFVKLLDGKMWVRSNTEGLQKGTTFYVQFPKKEDLGMITTEEKLAIDATILTKPEEENKLVVIPQKKSGKLILLIEDNRDLREYIHFLLTPYYQVVMAENGQEAIETLNKMPELPALIVCDVMMPIMDGFEFLERAKSKDIWRPIPVIMLTARAELKSKLKALRIGVDDYLLKPFQEVELLARIRNLINNYEERQRFFQEQEQEQEQLPILTTHSTQSDTTKVKEKKEKSAVLVVTEEDKIWLEKLEKTVLKEMDNSIFDNNYLAELLSIKRHTLYQKIKILTGLTPNQYLRTIRLQFAKELLEKSTYKSVKEVAKRVGFQKTAYFSKLFKQEFGKSPSEYLEL